MDDEVIEMLYRVDERTKRIDDEIAGVNKEIEANSAELDAMQQRVKRNTTILNGLTLGVGSLLTMIVTKVGDLFSFL